LWLDYSQLHVEAAKLTNRTIGAIAELRCHGEWQHLIASGDFTTRIFPRERYRSAIVRPERSQSADIGVV
jgi:hypothetical protein